MFKTFALTCLLSFICSTRACSEYEFRRLRVCASNYARSSLVRNMANFAAVADEIHGSERLLHDMCDPNTGVKGVMKCMGELVPRCFDRLTSGNPAVKKTLSAINFRGFVSYIDVLCNNMDAFSEQATVTCTRRLQPFVTECAKKMISDYPEDPMCGAVTAVDVCTKRYGECGEKMKEILTAMRGMFNEGAACNRNQVGRSYGRNPVYTIHDGRARGLNHRPDPSGSCVTSAVSIGLILFSLLMSSFIH